MSEGFGSLETLLDLEQIEEHIFRSSPPHVRGGTDRVYGGQVAAQSLLAAGRTVAEGAVHSLHSYFLRPGDLSVPIVFEVDRIRNGRSFTTRRVVAIQHGEAIFNLQCSFHRAEPGLEHADAMPEVPPPEELPDAAAIALEGQRMPLSTRPDSGLQLRFVTELPWERQAPGVRQQLWLRAASRLGDDPLVHAVALTFASDLTLLDAAAQRHGRSVSDPDFAGASLDHCMWFHRPARADEWLLYDQRSPAAGGARGLNIGSIYRRDGVLAVTVVQEGLLRFGRRPKAEATA